MARTALSTADYPRLLVTAGNALIDVLKAEHEQIGRPASIHALRVQAFSDGTKRSIRAFVREISRVEGGRPELLRRATLIRTMTENGTEFASALAEVRNLLDALRTLIDNDPKTGWVGVIDDVASFEALSELHFETLQHNIDKLYTYRGSLGLDDQRRTILLRLKEVTECVADALADANTTGCQALLLFGVPLSELQVASEFELFRKCIGDPETALHAWQYYSTLDAMVLALISLMEWFEANKQPSKSISKSRGSKADGTRALDLAIQHIEANPDIADSISKAALAKTVRCSPSVLSSPEAVKEIETAKVRARRASRDLRSGHWNEGRQVDGKYEEDWDSVDKEIDDR